MNYVIEIILYLCIKFESESSKSQVTKMKRLVFVMMVGGLLLSACQGQKSSSEATGESQDSTQTVDTTATTLEEEIAQEAPMPKAADELFDDFIFNFAANKKLQSSRVKFPLKVLRGEEVTYVSKGQWQMEYFFMNQDFYTLLFNSEDEMNRAKESTSIEHAVVEKIYLDAKTVKQFVFDRVKGVWMLQEVIHMPLSESQNASFLMFYDKFSKDEDAYQSKHLAESVRFVGPDPDDDFAQMEGVITPDTWEAFAPELPSGMIYNIVYGTPQKETGRKIFVLRGIANGLEMELTFKHEGDKWILTKLAT